jgi:mRNA-degrading endonuclease toxin of MazEF toxin-antitoxin module
VQADNVHTVPKQKLDRYVGSLDPETMREVSRKVILALELESFTY